MESFRIWLFLWCDCISSVQFSSVAQSCLTLCDPMNCSTPGLPVLLHLSELAQTHIHWVSDAIRTSQPLPPPSPSAQQQGLSQWAGSFPVSWLFASSDQSIGASASASVLPMNTQGWFPVGLTGLISLSKELSRAFSSTTVWKHQFFGTQLLCVPIKLYL